MRRPIEDMLVNVLQSALPSLEGLPADLVSELTSLENLSDKELERVMSNQVPSLQQRKLTRLLRKNQSGTLTKRERLALDTLQREADRVMLRKARAAVLLKWRGHRLPTLEELRQLVH